MCQSGRTSLDICMWPYSATEEWLWERYVTLASHIVTLQCKLHFPVNFWSLKCTHVTCLVMNLVGWWCNFDSNHNIGDVTNTRSHPFMKLKWWHPLLNTPIPHSDRLAFDPSLALGSHFSTFLSITVFKRPLFELAMLVNLWIWNYMQWKLSVLVEKSSI